MTPATATTTTKAVRQHGGGLVHTTLPRAVLSGRQQCPSGGVKKSLCCAAAGINALALQASATPAYPMTGVRQAQKLSTPLRSPYCPHAQLVVGYSRSIFRAGINTIPGTGCHHMKEGLVHPPVLIRVVDQPAFKTIDQRRNGRYQPFIWQIHKVNSLHRTQGAVRNLLQTLIAFRHTDLFPEHFIDFHKTIESLPGDYRNSFFCRGFPDYGLSFSDTILIGCQPNRGEDRADCSQAGKQRRVCVYYPLRHNQRGNNKSNNSNRRPHNHQRQPVTHPKGLFLQHLHPLYPSLNRPSLPAPCHHVQRGEA